jgi:hypothetical protein
VSDRTKNLRNAAIVVALAVIVWKLPGGATAGSTISNLLSVLLMAGFAFFAYRMYMENRTTLFDLPERLRVTLYASAGLAVITLIATGRMWNAGGAWILLWFALLGAAGYGIVMVVRHWRAY